MAVGDVCRADETIVTPKGNVRVRFCGPDNYVYKANPDTSRSTRQITLSGFSPAIYLSRTDNEGATYTNVTSSSSSPVNIDVSNTSARMWVGYTTSARTEEIFRLVMSPFDTIPSPYAGTTAKTIRTYEGSAAMRGTGTMTAQGAITVPIEGSAAIKGTGTMRATGQVIKTYQGAATIKGTGRMTATGTVTTVRQASAALTGTGRMNATGSVLTPVREASASLRATGTLAASGRVQREGVAVLAALGVLTATGVVVAPGHLEGAADITSAGELTGAGLVEREATVDFLATATLTAVAELLPAPPPPRQAPDPVGHVITTRQLVDMKVHPVSS